MEAANAFDRVRDRLEASFGKGMTMMIIASASNAAGVATVGMDPDSFIRLADAISRDQRVVDMWGSAAAADALVEWRRCVL